MDPSRLIPGDATLIENIVDYLKAKGIFDEFRHECLADVDTKSSCQNLSQRVDGYTSKFLASQTWDPDLNKNELRNKLRRHIDESGMLAIGADHVVEQVINPKIQQLFLPRIVEVVHQYMKEQSELYNKKSVPTLITENSSFDKAILDISDSNASKAKTTISDPIKDILSFSYAKTKPATSSHGKADSMLQKYVDLRRKKEESIVEKKKEESAVEKKKEESPIEKKKEEKIQEPIETSTDILTSAVPGGKVQIDIENIKKEIKQEELDPPQEISKKVVKEEVKLEEKPEDMKLTSSETSSANEENKTPVKPSISIKKDVDKNKQKVKLTNPLKVSSSSKDVKKPKRESSDKSIDKHSKSKSAKYIKESSSPAKSLTSSKAPPKEEKLGGSSTSKSGDSSSSKTSESSTKKSTNPSNSKSDSSIAKHRKHSEKSEKSKLLTSKNTDKEHKPTLSSSSYDSSQGSDQEKSSYENVKIERQKHFSKHARKDSSEKLPDKIRKTSNMKRTKESHENSFKKLQIKNKSKTENSKESLLTEAAKVSSRSNSCGSTSSVSSSSNASKDNLMSTSDEVSENSMKDKKKKKTKEKDPCHTSNTLPPPPPPSPPSSSLACELTSSAEMSSMEDTQSSTDSSESSSKDNSEESSSDLELDSKSPVLDTLDEKELKMSVDDLNSFYDIFLYSSSSSEFEGFGSSPKRKKSAKNESISDISVSSVHTSDLSSYEDELSDEFYFNDGAKLEVKKRLTLKEAQQLIQNKAALFSRNKNSPIEDKSVSGISSSTKRCEQRSSSFLSSEDESSPSEPKRLLRRERKLNPRYASSEYTSIFNSRKETFITKQASQIEKNPSPNTSPNIEPQNKEEELVLEKGETSKRSIEELKVDQIHNEEKAQQVKSTTDTPEPLQIQKESPVSPQLSSSDEIDVIMDKNNLFQENNKNFSSDDTLKLQLNFKPQNNSKLNINTFPVKRKLEMIETPPAKRPCSRSSVDSSSSEFATNENKPFNSENKILLDDKLIRVHNDLKASNLTEAIKTDLFCKQRTNNNGDVLGQKEILLTNSHGKTVSISEKKTCDSDTSKELSAL